MSDSRHCPECGANIGLWAVFKAPLPNRIFCPQCKQRLQHTPITGLVVVAVILTLVVCLGATYLGMQFGDDPVTGMLAGVGALVVGCAMLEVAFVTILWYGDYELKAVGKERPAQDAHLDPW